MSITATQQFGTRLCEIMGIDAGQVADIVLKCPVDGCVTIDLTVLVNQEQAEDVYAELRRYRLEMIEP